MSIAEQRDTVTAQAEHLAVYRYSLETAKAELILSGTIQGKNETERAASARMTLKLIYDNVDDAERLDPRGRLLSVPARQEPRHRVVRDEDAEGVVAERRRHRRPR